MEQSAATKVGNEPNGASSDERPCLAGKVMSTTKKVSVILSFPLAVYLLATWLGSWGGANDCSSSMCKGVRCTFSESKEESREEEGDTDAIPMHKMRQVVERLSGLLYLKVFRNSF